MRAALPRSRSHPSVRRTGPARRLGALVGALGLAVPLVLPLAVVGAVAGAAPARAASPGFASSFEAGDPTPEGTPFDPPVNVTGSPFAPGSLLPLVDDVTASAQNAPNETAAMLADGSPMTKWLAFASSGWAQYRLSEPAVVTSYALTSANDAAERDPKDFRLLGSTDGVDWQVLDEQTGQEFDGRLTTRTYPVSGAGSYAYFRLDISAINGADRLQLADWHLSREVTGPVDPTPILTEVGSGPTSSPTAALRRGFTGTQALRYAGSHLDGGDAGSTTLLYDVDVEIEADTELSYLLFPELDGALTYSSTYTAVDLVLDDGSRLSEHGLTDAYGFGASAREQGAGKISVPNQWNSVRVPLGALAGHRVTQVLLAYDSPVGSAGTPLSGWLDDVALAPTTVRDTSDGAVGHVDTRRGTNSSTSYSRGNNIPATAVPNGFNFFVPMTNGASQGTLYEYQRQNNAANLPTLQGIGISHQPSPWMGDRNQLAILPSASTSPTSSLTGRALEFRHDDETARPDLYSVEFTGGLTAEVTPTDHAGVYRFTFPGSTGSVLVDRVSGDASLTIGADGVLTGWVDGGSGLSVGRTRMFVHGEFDRTPTDTGATPNGDRSGVARYAAFDVSDGGAVELRIATSFLSLDQARHNLGLEVEGRSFDDVRAAAVEAWNERLGVIEVDGASDDHLTTLYSNLYRLNLYPNSQFENVGSAAAPEYRYASPVSATSGAATATETNATVMDGKIYVNHGFWDTYRTAWPAYALLYPDLAEELVDGFVQHYRDGGWISRWSSPGYADLMTGTSSDVSFAEAYLAGALSTEVALDAYDAALRNATALPPSDAVGRKGIDSSIFLGYTPSSTHESASWGLEGFINDFGIAQMAAALAEDPQTPPERVERLIEEADYFTQRAQHYVLMYNPEAGVFTSREADGSFAYGADFDKTAWGGAYTEASGWTFAFHAPFDVDGLAALYGGRAGLLAELDEFFTTPETAAHSGIHEAFEARDVRLGMLGMSNQVAHHIPYIPAAAGDPSRTQELVREITQRLFAGSDIGQGYLGDEDNGEMSAWWLFSALGFYPLAVGSGDYTVGSPVFDRATVHLASGDLTITAPGASDGQVYVAGLTVDGEPVAGPTLDGDLLRGASTLAFTMSDEPSTWGSLDVDEVLEVPVQRVDATGFGTLTSDPAVPGGVGALTDDSSRSSVTFDDGAAELTWSSGTGPVEVDGYTLTSVTADTAPVSWTLEASSDGTVWTTLDERADEVFAWDGQTRPFGVATPAAGTLFRLTLAAADGVGLGLAEIELFGTSAGDSDLLVTAAPGPIRARVDAEVTAPLATVAGGATEAAGHEVTVDFGDGTAPQAGALTPTPLGSFTVTAPHTFAKAGTYPVTVRVESQGSVASAVVEVEVSRDLTLAGAFDNVCIGDLGSVPANCDGQNSGYDRAKLASTGFVQGTTVAVPGTDLTFDLPEVTPGEPDNATGAGQTIHLDLGEDATQVSVIAAATENAKRLVGQLTYADGGVEDIALDFGDWVGAASSPAFGNVVVGVSDGRLSGTGAEGGSPKRTAVYASAPHDLRADSEVVSLTLPVEEGTLRHDGRMHVFAIASDGDRAAATPLAVTGTPVGGQIAGEAFEADLATYAGGFERDAATATVTWGDGSPVVDATVTGDTVRAGHTYTAPGTYPVTVTVDDGTTSASAVVPVVVEAAEPEYAPEIAVDPATVVAGGTVSVTGTGFAPAEAVTVTVGPLAPVAATTDGSGTLTALVTVPTDSATGTYPVTALGAVSAVAATATLLVTAAPAPPVLTASVASAEPGQTLEVRAAGFSPGEVLAVELHSDPVLLGTATVDSAGNAVLAVTVPLDTTVGEHTLVGLGRSSELVASVPLAVVAAPGPSPDPSPSPDPGPEPGAGPGPGSGSPSGTLPWTGPAGLLPSVLAALALLATGAVLLRLRRRRQA